MTLPGAGNAGTGPKPFGSPSSQTEDEFNVSLNTDEIYKKVNEGPNIAKVVDVVSKPSKQGNPMWEWTFVVTEGPMSGEELKTWTVLQPNSLWKVHEVLMALGVSQAEGGDIKFKRSNVINVGCVLEVTSDIFQGRPQPKVGKVLPHPRGAGFKLDGAPRP